MPNYSNSTSAELLYEDDFLGSGNLYEYEYEDVDLNQSYSNLDNNLDSAENETFLYDTSPSILSSDSDEGFSSGSGSPPMIDQNVTFSTNFEETTNKTIFHSIIGHSTIFPTNIETGSTIAHGLGNGLVNIAVQGTSTHLAKKNTLRLSAILLSLGGGIFQACYAATFPLMLYELNKLVAEGNEQEAQERWKMMTLEMLPVFFTSLTLSTGLQLLNYFNKNYLSKQPMLKSLIQSIPTVSTLCSVIQNPISAGIYTVSAYAASTLGLFGHNLNINKENHRNASIETNKKESEDSVELVLLKERKMDINNSIASTTYNQQFFKNSIPKSSIAPKNSAAFTPHPEEMNEGTVLRQLLKK